MIKQHRAVVREGCRLNRLRDRYDLIIIGGGVYGAALAWEAASRGLSAILLEKDDFGSGTSANSLKVIHGGFRYLQDLDFSRVRESVRERRALTRIAPHLVRPLACIIPTYKELTRSKTALRVGLKLYDMLAYDRNRGVDAATHIAPGKIISRSTMRSLLPDLSDDDLTGGARWYDAQVFNSERLVLSFILSAKERGAHVLNHTAVSEYLVERGTITGVAVKDGFSGRCVEILGDAVVDCTGPWAYQSEWFQRLFQPKCGDRLAKAVNLVVRRRLSDSAIGFRVAKGPSSGDPGRFLFSTPWHEGAIIGTWYLVDQGPPEDVVVRDSEIIEAISQVNGRFQSLNLTRDDVTLVHVGLLPIESISKKGKEPHLARKFYIIDAARLGGPRKLFWIQGIKYTTARHVAARAIDKIARSVSKTIAVSTTDCLWEEWRGGCWSMLRISACPDFDRNSM